MARGRPVKINFIAPMDALAVRKLPEGPDWFYEISSTAIGV